VELKAFNVFFDLPSFSVQPEIQLTGINGDLLIHFNSEEVRKIDIFAPLAEIFVNVNGQFSFEGKQYWLNTLMSTMVGGYQATKIYPLEADQMPFY
jgi:hypothetical protein